MLEAQSGKLRPHPPMADFGRGFPRRVDTAHPAGMVPLACHCGSPRERSARIRRRLRITARKSSCDKDLPPLPSDAPKSLGVARGLLIDELECQSDSQAMHYEW